MTEPDSAAPAEPAYDAGELRARMGGCFTAGELRELADRLGVEGVRADSSAADAARVIVRHFERSGALGSLVAEVRDRKPLVEWPEPIAKVEPPPFTFGDAPPLAPLAIPEGLAAPEVSEPANEPDGSAPPALDAPAAPDAAAFTDAPEELDGPIIQDPHAPPAAPAEPWISGGDGVVRPGGHASTPPRASRGIDPRILLAVAAMTLLAAAFAFAAGRATSRPVIAESAAAPSAAIVTPKKAGGPAALAANALSRSLADVARVCEVPLGDPPGAELLRAAFDQCGPRPQPVQPAVAIPPVAAAPQPSADPTTDRQRPVSPGGNDALPPGPSDSTCMKGCQSDHSSCKSKCGAEPTDASKYGDYQSCLIKCLAGASKCRLKCQQ